MVFHSAQFLLLLGILVNDYLMDILTDVELRVTAKWPCMITTNFTANWPYMIHQIVPNLALNPNKL